jgi:hypothetical protein
MRLLNSSANSTTERHEAFDVLSSMTLVHQMSLGDSTMLFTSDLGVFVSSVLDTPELLIQKIQYVSWK